MTTTVPVLPMKPVAKAQVQDLVKRAIDKNIENKYASSQIANGTYVYTGGVTGASIVNVLPQVQVGDESWQRNGATIRPKQLVIKGTIAIRATENRAIRPLVRIMCWSMKEAKSYNSTFAIGNTSIANLLLDYGSGGTGPYTGLPISAHFPLNRKRLAVHFDKQVVLANSLATGANTEFADEHKRYYRFAIKIKTPATFKYDDNVPAGPGTNYPQNFAPQMAISYCYPDGSVDGTEPPENPLVWYAVTQLYYEDA